MPIAEGQIQAAVSLTFYMQRGEEYVVLAEALGIRTTDHDSTEYGVLFEGDRHIPEVLSHSAVIEMDVSEIVPLNLRYDTEHGPRLTWGAPPVDDIAAYWVSEITGPGCYISRVRVTSYWDFLAGRADTQRHASMALRIRKPDKHKPAGVKD